MTSVLKVDNIQNSSGTSAISIDDDGRVLKSNLPHVWLNGTSTWQACSTSATTITLWGNTASDAVIEGGMSYSNGVITVPVDGVYLITGIISFELDNAEWGRLQIAINDTQKTQALAYNVSAGGQVENTVNLSGAYKLSANDTVRIKQYGSSTGVRYLPEQNWSNFSVVLIG